MMGDSAPGQQPPDAQETAEDQASAELAPEPQVNPAPPPPGDPATDNPTESKFHG